MVLVLKISNFQMSWILCKKLFFKIFSILWVFSVLFSIFRYFSVFFGIQYQKCLILKKKFQNIFWNYFQKIFRIFTGFSGFFGLFGISVLPKIWVLPFNSIEYWKCSIPKFQYYWIPKKVPIPKFNNTKKNQYFSPP